MRQLTDGNHREWVRPNSSDRPSFAARISSAILRSKSMRASRLAFASDPPRIRRVSAQFLSISSSVSSHSGWKLRIVPICGCRASLLGPAASKPPTGRICKRREPSPDFACGLPMPWAGSARFGEARRSRFRSAWIPYSCSWLMLLFDFCLKAHHACGVILVGISK